MYDNLFAEWLKNERREKKWKRRKKIINRTNIREPNYQINHKMCIFNDKRNERTERKKKYLWEVFRRAFITCFIKFSSGRAKKRRQFCERINKTNEKKKNVDFDRHFVPK